MIDLKKPEAVVRLVRGVVVSLEPHLNTSVTGFSIQGVWLKTIAPSSVEDGAFVPAESTSVYLCRADVVAMHTALGEMLEMMK
jgi:hypothetical protein